ncbi:MAG: lipid-A-disaccharide synthase [Planctomycetota bacterium]
MTEPRRVFFSVGDVSGDQHAARLLRHLQQLVPGLQAEGLAGPELVAAGCTSHADLVSQGIFGIRGALAALPQMFALLRRVAGLFDARRPDLVVIVDYPGLNLYIARLAARRGIPVVYFIAPQLWAWAPWRLRRFARVVDEALVIFPFEERFFTQSGLPAHYIGHPVLDALAAGESALADSATLAALRSRPRAVALLPGSRPSEVRANMPLLLNAAREVRARYPDVSFHSAHVSPTEAASMAALAKAAGLDLTIHGDEVHAVMAGCRCAVVASGTATLETALLGTPLVVIYRVSNALRLLARALVIPEWVSQVNLIAGRAVCPEHVQSDDDPAALIASLTPLLEDSEAWRAQKQGVAEVRRRMGAPGAIERAAQRVAARLQG